MRSSALARFCVFALLLAVLGACARPTCGLPGQPGHHGIGGFCNQPGAPEPEAGAIARGLDGIRLAFARERGPIPAGFHLSPEEVRAGLADPAPDDRITWLGHATTLIRLDGRTVLTDPVWSTYVTPVPPIGPKRVAAPPLPIEALPPIDVVLLTHDHFDHLDLPTLRALPGKHRIEMVVPLGLGRIVRSLGFARVTEMDWWEEREIAGLSIRALPAAHTSQRRAFRPDETLWASFAITGRGREASRVFVSGDTGYHTHFAEIGERYGPFDLAVVYLGGYGPREVARARHVTPREAVRASDELGARASVPVHWGTYPLGAEPTFKPGPAFLVRAREAGWAPGRAVVMRVGETRAIRRAPAVAARH